MQFHHPADSVLSDFSDLTDQFGELLASKIAAPALVIHEDTSGEISLIDAIEAGWEQRKGEGAQPEFTPEEIGRLPGYSRTSALRSAETYAMASLCRIPAGGRINTERMGPLIHQVALWSDNPFGESTIGALRYAGFIACSERYCRSMIIQAINYALINCRVRPGQTPALSLRYPRAIIAASSAQISNAIAPPRLPPGRPLSPGKPRKSCIPGFCADETKTPEVIAENPGSDIGKPRNYSGSATKISSLKELTKRKGEEDAPASPALSGSEVQPGSTGADYLWEALEGQGLQKTKSHNIRAMRQTMAACEWIGRLSMVEAQQLASVCASSETFWPRTALLSECARQYFEKLQRADEDRQRYRSEIKAYEDYQKKISEAEAAAAKIEAEFPWIDETADWRAAEQRRKSIREAQAAAGIDPRLADRNNRPVMIKPHEPLDTEVRFTWPKTATKASRWQA